MEEIKETEHPTDGDLKEYCTKLTADLDKSIDLIAAQTKEYFDRLNAATRDASHFILQEWIIRSSIDAKLLEHNPYEQFIEMLTWYIDEAKKSYINHLREMGVKVPKEEKDTLNEVKAKEAQESKNKPAELVYIEQTRKLTME